MPRRLLAGLSRHWLLIGATSQLSPSKGTPGGSNAGNGLKTANPQSRGSGERLTARMSGTDGTTAGTGSGRATEATHQRSPPRTPPEDFRQAPPPREPPARLPRSHPHGPAEHGKRN